MAKALETKPFGLPIPALVNINYMPKIRSKTIIKLKLPWPGVLEPLILVLHRSIARNSETCFYFKSSEICLLLHAEKNGPGKVTATVVIENEISYCATFRATNFVQHWTQVFLKCVSLNPFNDNRMLLHISIQISARMPM